MIEGAGAATHPAAPVQAAPLPYLPAAPVVPPGTEFAPNDEQTTLQAWQGPYPPPEAALQFEKILPGSFDRIMRMAEQSQAAQIDIAGKAQLFLQRDVRRGHYLDALVSIVSIAAVLGCAAVGQPVVAVALVGIPVMAVAKALIEGRHPPPSTPDDTA